MLQRAQKRIIYALYTRNQVVKMKIETGCARTTIHTNLIPPEFIKKSIIDIIAATGETRNYKLLT